MSEYTSIPVGRKKITVSVFKMGRRYYLDITSIQKEICTWVVKKLTFPREDVTTIQSRISKAEFEEYKEMGVEDRTRSIAINS